MEELTTLIETTGRGEEYRGLSGLDRSMLYLLAAFTGLRVGSLLKLTVESFTLDGGEAKLVVARPETTKNRKAHVVPLPPDIGGKIGRWLTGKRPGEKLWHWPAYCSGDAAKLLRHDLMAAGIPYRDAAGSVCDFHALRGQYATMLVISVRSNLRTKF